MTDLLLLTYAQLSLVPRLANVHAAYRQRVVDIQEAETLEQLLRGLKGLPHDNLWVQEATSVLGLAGAAAAGDDNVTFVFLLREAQAGVPEARVLLRLLWGHLLDLPS